MATPLYTRRFLIYDGTGSVSYTVPAGYVAVVHCVTLCDVADANSTVVVAMQVGGTGTAYRAISFTSPLSYSGATWTGRVVFNAGDVMSVDANYADAQGVISGQLLTSP